MKVVSLKAAKAAAERKAYAALVLETFDRMTPAEEKRKAAGKPNRLDTDPAVRLKAKSQL
jgi:hypothetical protein